MRTRNFLAALALLLPSCTNPPPLHGTFANKDGRITVHPDGRFEVVVEAKPSK